VAVGLIAVALVPALMLPRARADREIDETAAIGGEGQRKAA
jgi:hypothetical protein